MLVLQKAGRLHRIVPIVLGEAWSDDRATPSMASFEDFKKWIDANVPDSRSETTYQRLLEILPHLGLSSDTASSLNLNTQNVILSLLRFDAIVRLVDPRMLLPSAGSAAQSTSYTETFMKNAAGWDFFHVIAE